MARATDTLVKRGGGDRPADGSGLELALVRAGEVLGVVNAVVAADGTAELGWWADAEVEGTGVARRAAQPLAEHLVGCRVSAGSRPAEWCGFSWDATLPGHERIAGADVDCIAYVRRR